MGTVRTIREWLRQRLTPLGRYDRRCAREYDAMLKRHEAYVREHADEIRARSPRRVVSIDCLTVGCRWGDSGSPRCECR